MAHADPRRQLEQHVQRGAVLSEPQQRPLERQHEHRVPPGSPSISQNRASQGTRGSAEGKRSLAPPCGETLTVSPLQVAQSKAAAGRPTKKGEYAETISRFMVHHHKL